MNFIDAMNNMLAGKRMIRMGWSGFYLIIITGQNYIWSIGKDSVNNTNTNIYTPSIDDILATDWIVKVN
jgi:hypothetical protein